MWGRRSGVGIAIFFVLFALTVAAIFAASGCTKEQPPIKSGVVQDKSHYPAAEIKHYDCDRNGENCELDRIENKPERCTLSVAEDNTSRVGEVQIECTDLDSYNKGDRYPKGSSPPPSPPGGS